MWGFRQKTANRYPGDRAPCASHHRPVLPLLIPPNSPSCFFVKIFLVQLFSFSGHFQKKAKVTSWRRKNLARSFWLSQQRSPINSADLCRSPTQGSRQPLWSACTQQSLIYMTLISQVALAHHSTGGEHGKWFESETRPHLYQPEGRRRYRIYYQQTLADINAEKFKF